MADEPIRTIVEGAAVEFTVDGSRFIGHVASADSVSGAETVVDAVEAEHPDATHVVWAYRLTGSPPIERASDAGEPSGSAGKPALGVLRGEALEGIVAVVVRYYGGTNLGYGGLVRAYTTAVADAIEAATTEVRQPSASVSIEVAYDDSGSVHAILDGEDVAYDASYDTRVRIDASVPVDRVGAVLDRINSATSGRADIDW